MYEKGACTGANEGTQSRRGLFRSGTKLYLVFFEKEIPPYFLLF